MGALTVVPVNAVDAYRYRSDFEHPRSFSLPHREPYSPVPVERWDSATWPPGTELTFYLKDSPHWTTLFKDVHDVERTFEAALATWSDIESADVSWSVEVRPLGTSTLDIASVEVDESHVPFSTLISYTGIEELIGCRITVGSSFLQDLTKSEILVGFKRELGHCLGLDSPGAYTHFERRPSTYESPSGWNREPLMGDGTGPPTADDRAAASLFRPAPGWLDRVGSILGYVLTDNDAHARWVYVLATRMRADGSLAESVGRLTDRAGVFVIGGLAPGDYVLSVRPFRQHAGSLPLPILFEADQGLPLVFGESLLASPVSVAAGRQAGPVGLTIRPARDSDVSGPR